MAKGSAVFVAAHDRVGAQLPLSTHARLKPGDSEGDAVLEADRENERAGEAESQRLGVAPAREAVGDTLCVVLAEKVADTQNEGEEEAEGVMRKGEAEAVVEDVWLREARLGVDVVDAEGAPMERVVVCEPDTLGEELPVFELVVVAVLVVVSRPLPVRAGAESVTVGVEVVEPLREGVREAELEARDAV